MPSAASFSVTYAKGAKIVSLNREIHEYINLQVQNCAVAEPL
jgi:hypothetical protein